MLSCTEIWFILLSNIIFTIYYYQSMYPCDSNSQTTSAILYLKVNIWFHHTLPSNNSPLPKYIFCLVRLRKQTFHVIRLFPSTVRESFKIWCKYLKKWIVSTTRDNLSLKQLIKNTTIKFDLLPHLLFYKESQLEYLNLPYSTFIENSKFSKLWKFLQNPHFWALIMEGENTLQNTLIWKILQGGW